MKAKAETFARVLDGKDWIFYVSHKKNSAWEIFPSDYLNSSEEKVSSTFDALAKIDPTLKQLADLQVGWHAWRQSKQFPWESAEIPEGKLYLISYDAEITDLHPEFGKIGGAVINAWIIAKNLKEARTIATNDIENEGFAITEELKNRVVTPEDYDDEHREYIEQAKIDGSVFVFYAYPPEKTKKK